MAGLSGPLQSSPRHAYDSLRRRVKSNTLGVTSETAYKGLTTESHR